ncbi:MAG: hypothetical protein HEQ23_00160 [Tepidisphaera sp.]
MSIAPRPMELHWTRAPYAGPWFWFHLCLHVAGAALVTLVALVRSGPVPLKALDFALAIGLWTSAVHIAVSYAHGPPSLKLDPANASLELRHLVLYRFLWPRQVRHLSVPYGHVRWFRVVEGSSPLLMIALADGTLKVSTAGDSDREFLDELRRALGPAKQRG